MNTVNDTERKKIQDEIKRKNKYNKNQRERYKRTVRINPLKIRPATKEENKRKKENINKRQTLLQTQQTTNKNKSKKKIQGKNEKS